MRRRDSNPAEASTLAASQVNPPRALLHGHRLAFPNRPVTCVKRTMRQVTNGASASATTRRDRHGYGAWHGGP